jgi:DNA-binding XRE family transcriptional regulator
MGWGPFRVVFFGALSVSSLYLIWAILILSVLLASPIGLFWQKNICLSKRPNWDSIYAMRNFALKLKELREKAGLTQEQLAKKAGIHRFTVAKLEQDLREPGWSVVQSLASALGVDCSAFQDPIGNGQAPAPRGRPAKATDKAGTKPKKRRA